MIGDPIASLAVHLRSPGVARVIPPNYLSTLRLFLTEKTPDTPFA